MKKTTDENDKVKQQKEYQFNAYILKVIKNAAYSYLTQEDNKWNKKIILTEIAEMDIQINSNKNIIASTRPSIDEFDNVDIKYSIEQLPDELRRIIYLFYFYNYTDKEIAISLNYSKKHVSYLRRKALELLKKSLYT